MADDKNFKELVKEMQDLNKSITKQNEGREGQLTDLVKSQNRTTEMVTRRLTKTQTEQLEKDDEQIRVAKEESDRQSAADKKSQELEKKKFAIQKFKDRVAKLADKAPSALLRAAKMATYNNRVMRNVAKGLKGISKGLGITAFAKKGLKTVWGTIKKLIQGGFLIGGIILLDKFFNSDTWPKVINFIENKIIPGFIAFGKWVMKEFGPGVNLALFGEGGTFKKPTGGLYGGIIGFFKILGEIGENMKDDDTAGKLAKTIKSFVKLIFSLFGMGRKELVQGSYGGEQKTVVKKGYFENILDAAATFKNDFISLFESVINTVGQAFAEAHPIIARIFGIDSKAEYDMKQVAKENLKISGDIKEIALTRGEGAVSDYVSRLSLEDKEYASKYAQAIDKFEKSKPFMDRNLRNNAIVSGILGTKNLDMGQDAATGFARVFNGIRNLFNISRKGEPTYGMDSGGVDTFAQALEQSLKKMGLFNKENVAKILRNESEGIFKNKDEEKEFLSELVKISKELEKERNKKRSDGIIGNVDGVSSGGNNEALFKVDASQYHKEDKTIINNTKGGDIVLARDGNLALGAFSGGQPF